MDKARPVGPMGYPIRVHEDHYPFWRDHISPEIRNDLVEEDVRAGETVVAEILAIVGSVMLLGAMTVVFFCR